MGLSSSQARLLNLTNRMHQIEYNAARIEAMKLQMANESRRVYEDYLEALDQAKIQKKTLTTNGAVTFVDIQDYDDLIKSGFKLVVHGIKNAVTGQRISDDYAAYQEKTDAEKVAYLTGKFTPSEAQPADWSTMSASDQLNWLTTHGGSDYLGGIMYTETTNSGSNGSVICNNSGEVVSAIAQILNCNPADVNISNFEEFLTNMINCGYVTIVQSNGFDESGNRTFPTLEDVNFHDYETSVAINTNLQEVTDDIKLRKAEAKYEADMKRIDLKDRRYDSDLAALDNERNAIKQEMETLKTVARDNVDRTFKIFS